MIGNNIALGKIEAAEENIYHLIKMKKKYKFQSLLVYDTYNSLFQFFLRFKPQKVYFLISRPSCSGRLCSLTSRWIACP